MSENTSQPSITKAQARHIVNVVRGMLGLQGTYSVSIVVMAGRADQVAALSGEHEHRLHKSNCEEGVLIYAQQPFEEWQFGRLHAQVGITTANWQTLPTENLRLQARELLGLEVEA